LPKIAWGKIEKQVLSNRWRNDKNSSCGGIGRQYTSATWWRPAQILLGWQIAENESTGERCISGPKTPVAQWIPGSDARVIARAGMAPNGGRREAKTSNVPA